MNKYEQKYKSKRKVTVKCYGEEEVYNNRDEAIKHFQECQRNSEGSERERYTNILCGLMFTSNDLVCDYENE